MIPLSAPNLSGRELEYVSRCIQTGWISSAGEFVPRFEAEFASTVGVQSAVSTMNGTAALHLGLKLLGVDRDHLVLMPNVTFVASANAISYLGAEPILFDIDPTSWQMDLDLLEEFLDRECHCDDDGTLIYAAAGRRITALMVVHVQGHMCDMPRLTGICSRYGLKLIEDAAEALGSTCDGKAAGTFGDIGCFSFNGNKIMSTGGGGMLIARNDSLVEKARHLATTAKTDPMRYHHDDVGFNYRLVNVLAAIGVAQLEQLAGFVSAKRAIANTYESSLEGVGDIRFQKSQVEVAPNHWLFTMQTARMEELLEFLNKNEVMSRPFWAPMNTLPMYENCHYVSRGDVSATVHQSALSLPCSTNLTREDQNFVIQKIHNFFGA